MNFYKLALFSLDTTKTINALETAKTFRVNML